MNGSQKRRDTYSYIPKENLAILAENRKVYTKTAPIHGEYRMLKFSASVFKTTYLMLVTRKLLRINANKV